MARQNSVEQLFFHRLDHPGIVLPVELCTKLKNTLLRNAARNMLIFQELSPLLQRLKKENIPVILLKGAYLAEKVYDNIALRTMSDIDLLIPEPELKKVIEISETMGFIAERPFWAEADGVLHFHAPPMLKNGLFIEIHWNLTRESNLSKINTVDIWRRAQKIVFNGYEAYALSLSDLVLHLAVHASYGHHFHNQFRSLCDLDEVLHKYKDELDWDEIIQVCHEWEAEQGTYLALRLVEDLLGAEVPGNVMAALRPSDWNEKILEWAKRNLFQVTPVLSENYIRVMHSRRLERKIWRANPWTVPVPCHYGHGIWNPSDSWRTIARYPYHAFTRIQKYWRHAWDLLRGDQLQADESKSDQSLRDWLGIP